VQVFGPPLSSSRFLLLGQPGKGCLGGQHFDRSRSSLEHRSATGATARRCLRHSGNDRCRIMRLSFHNPPLPGPRFCPESALRHDGVRRVRSSKLTARAWAPHRDRNGL